MISEQAGVTDPLGNTVAVGSDKMGRITKLTSPLGAVFSTGYDAMGRIVSSTDALGNSSSLVRDPRGLVTSASLPGGTINAAYTYTALEQVSSVTDRSWAPLVPSSMPRTMIPPLTAPHVSWRLAIPAPNPHAMFRAVKESRLISSQNGQTTACAQL